MEPDVAPYRNLPDTDFGGYLHSLAAVEKLDLEIVYGGHTGLDNRRWVTDYRDYLLRLRSPFVRAADKCCSQTEDGFAMTERLRIQVTQAAADSIADRFGPSRGFTARAPQTADRILSYPITGN